MGFNTTPYNPFPASTDQKGSGGGGSYVLPIASAETLGGVKVGDNLTVEEDGTLNAADPYTPPDYDTDEVLTGQKWIDGKDIYSKVISLGNLPNASEKKVSAGISGASVLMIEGYYDTGSAVSNLFNITALSNFVYNATTDEVVINVSSDLSAVTAFAILYYTKPVTN